MGLVDYFVFHKLGFKQKKGHQNDGLELELSYKIQSSLTKIAVMADNSNLKRQIDAVNVHVFI